MPATKTRSLLPIAAALAVGMLVSACQVAGRHQAGGPPTHTTAAVRITITPASGSAHVNPGAGITVTASGGKLTSVTVAGGQVAGSMNASGSAWHSRWTLPV